jgi:nicotinamide riboside transporter PnuC
LVYHIFTCIDYFGCFIFCFFFGLIFIAFSHLIFWASNFLIRLLLCLHVYVYVLCYATFVFQGLHVVLSYLYNNLDIWVKKQC